MSEQGWVVHVTGPDDVLPQPDRATAYRVAQRINAETLTLSDDDLNHPYAPTCWAVPKPCRHSWTYGDDVRSCAGCGTTEGAGA